MEKAEGEGDCKGEREELSLQGGLLAAALYPLSPLPTLSDWRNIYAMSVQREEIYMRRIY